MEWIEVFKAVLYGIIEGITEWLPISSTGHLIILEKMVPLNMSDQFIEMFRVVIQLGAILAVVVMYWHKIWPVRRLPKQATGAGGKLIIRPDVMSMWGKIVVACVPAGIVGVLFDDQIDALFYNYTTVAIMLIIIGMAFFAVENYIQRSQAKVVDLSEITWLMAVTIGMFQLLAAVLPGTSRSGATILGGILIGLTRAVAAEFTFFLAIPVMFGASLLKLLKLHFALSGMEALVLFIGMAVSFVVSYYAITFLMRYIKRHDFKPFGYYRIALGILVLVLFSFVL